MIQMVSFMRVPPIMARLPLKMKFPNSENLWLRLYILNRFFLNPRITKKMKKLTSKLKQNGTTSFFTY